MRVVRGIKMPLLKSPQVYAPVQKGVDKRNLGSTLETRGRIFAGYVDQQAVKPKLVKGPRGAFIHAR
jgi:hypothetical protein